MVVMLSVLSPKMLSRLVILFVLGAFALMSYGCAINTLPSMPADMVGMNMCGSSLHVKDYLWLAKENLTVRFFEFGLLLASVGLLWFGRVPTFFFLTRQTMQVWRRHNVDLCLHEYWLLALEAGIAQPKIY